MDVSPRPAEPDLAEYIFDQWHELVRLRQPQKKRPMVFMSELRTWLKMNALQSVITEPDRKSSGISFVSLGRQGSKDIEPSALIWSLRKPEARGQLAVRFKERIKNGNLHDHYDAKAPIYSAFAQKQFRQQNLFWTQNSLLRNSAAEVTRRFFAKRFFDLIGQKYRAPETLLKQAEQIAFYGLRRARKQALRQFLDHLDPVAVTAMRKNHLIDPMVYNWLTTPAETECRVRRAHALTNLPLLYPFLQEPDKVKDLETVIDSGKPWHQAAAEVIFGTPQAVPLIRALHGVGVGSVVNPHKSPFHVSKDVNQKSFSKLAPLQPNWLPKGRHEWSILFEHYKSFQKALGQTAGLSDLFIEGKGDWSGIEQRLKTLKTARQGINDFISTVFNRVVLPVLVQQTCDDKRLATTIKQGQLFPSLHEHIWAGIPPEGLISRSNDWHQNLHFYRLYEGSALSQNYLVWPALTPEVTAPNGAALVPLTSSALLNFEHEVMDHCVHDYSHDCRTGKAHILRINLNDTPLSTLGLEFQAVGVGGTQHAVIFQNYGYKNDRRAQGHTDEAHPVAAEAATWYVEQINAGKIKVDWDMLAAPPPQDGLGKLVARIGYDPLDQGTHQFMFASYQKLLPKAKKCATVEEWRDRLDLPRFLHKEWPQLFKPA